MTESHSNEELNRIRDRLGLCPIEKVQRGKSQNKDGRSIVTDQTFEEALEAFKEKYGEAEVK